MVFSFHFSSLYPAPYIELYVCLPIQISYLNVRAVLVLPKMAGSAQANKSMSFIWIVWSTLYVYLWFQVQPSSLRHRHLLVKVLYPQLLLKQRLHLSQLLKTRLQCPHLQFWPNLRNQSALHLHHRHFLNQLRFCQKLQSNHQFQKLQYKNLKVAKLGIHFKRYVFLEGVPPITGYLIAKCIK